MSKTVTRLDCGTIPEGNVVNRALAIRNDYRQYHRNIYADIIPDEYVRIYVGCVL